MRIKDVILEDDYKAKPMGPDDASSAEKLVEILQSECSDIISAYSASGKMLFRGENNNSSIFTKKIRPNRIPVEMKQDAHKLIHKYMLANGMEATRMNSIFCSGKYDIAESWGSTVYAVFPRNGWKASWFNGLSQSEYSFTELANMAYDARNKEYGGSGKIDMDDFNRMLTHFFKKNPPVTTSSPEELAGYLSTDPFEIMVTGDSYIAIRYSVLETNAGTKILNALNISTKL